MPAAVVASSVLCPAGGGGEQAWATVRAGISRIGSSHVLDRHLEPIAMGLVPEDALEPELPPEIDRLPLPARARRMLRLAAPALRPVSEQAGTPLRLYLGMPELTAAEAPWIRGFALYLGKVCGATIDAPNSRVVPSGRAAALTALELALGALERDPSHPVIVGGVDTYFDLTLLAALDLEQRLRGHFVMDGFTPGEGAAFLLLSADPGSAAANGKRVSVEAAAVSSDPGHRGGSEPARGEGLAEAIETLRSRLASATPVGSTFSALNGESLDAKLWGVAQVRHTDFFAPAMTVEHPAGCYGDAGAAAGAILLALAAMAVSRGDRAAPALVWAASDGAARGCALLSAA